MEGKRGFAVPQKRQQQQQPPQQREARRGLFTGPKPLYGTSMPQVGFIVSISSSSVSVHVQGSTHQACSLEGLLR